MPSIGGSRRRPRWCARSARCRCAACRPAARGVSCGPRITSVGATSARRVLSPLWLGRARWAWRVLGTGPLEQTAHHAGYGRRLRAESGHAMASKASSRPARAISSIGKATSRCKQRAGHWYIYFSFNCRATRSPSTILTTPRWHGASPSSATVTPPPPLLSGWPLASSRPFPDPVRQNARKAASLTAQARN
jgi:hypothetical protein